MAVKVVDLVEYSGSVNLVVGSEVVVIEVVGDGTHQFTVEGWIDVSSMQSGDEIVITEYISVDGVNYNKCFDDVVISGSQSASVYHFHGRMFGKGMKYKVAVTQTAGTARSVPYCFIVEKVEVTQ